MDYQSINQALHDLPVPALRFFETIGSTNDEALAWADTAAENGSLVVADTQTAGRGRSGRKWITHPGSALAFSVILRPTPEEIRRLSLFTALGTLAISDALQRTLGIEAGIKWPNDVLIRRRKTAGVLVEASWQGSAVQHVVIGIGLNVATSSVPTGMDLEIEATSLEDALSRSVDRVTLLRDILDSMFAWRNLILTRLFITTWNEKLVYKGENVSIHDRNMTIATGKLMGIKEDGSLRLLDHCGMEKEIQAGDLKLRPTRQNISSPEEFYVR